MKLKEDLMLREIGENWVIVPMGERLYEFNGMIEVNESGAFIIKQLEQEILLEDIVEAIKKEYDIIDESVEEMVDEYLGVLHSNGMIEEK